MSYREEAQTLLWHSTLTALLVLSELASKLFLKRFGSDFLSTTNLELVETALGWFTVGTWLLFLGSCFVKLLFTSCEAIVKLGINWFAPGA